MYKNDILKEYIEKSELRIFKNTIKIRLSSDLAKKYDNKEYDKCLNTMCKNIELLNTLNLKYPGNAKPSFYLYIVPNDNYTDLLNIPKIFDNGTGGGRPVNCFDLDGYHKAYGVSENLMYRDANDSISMIENEIHEFVHIIHSSFCEKNQSIHEGFAEAVPLFVFDLENEFTEHKELLKKIKKEDILSMKELLNQEYNNTFGEKELLPNKSCSFRQSYLSSYLFVRGCMEKIIERDKCSKKESVQKLLEILKNSTCVNEWLIYDIANELGMNKEELLNTIDLQINVLNEIINNN